MIVNILHSGSNLELTNFKFKVKKKRESKREKKQKMARGKVKSDTSGTLIFS